MAQQYEEHKNDWTCTDRSRESPDQQDRDDCRDFTLLSMYLSKQGPALTLLTYSHTAIVERGTHMRLAWAILNTGIESRDTPWQHEPQDRPRTGKQKAGWL